MQRAVEDLELLLVAGCSWRDVGAQGTTVAMSALHLPAALRKYVFARIAGDDEVVNRTTNWNANAATEYFRRASHMGYYASVWTGAGWQPARVCCVCMCVCG